MTKKKLPPTQVTVDDFVPHGEQSDSTETTVTSSERVDIEGQFFDREEIIEGMRTSLDIFANILVPDVATEPFADIHYSVWNELTDAILKDKGLDRHAIAIPRGHAKTFLLKLLCCYAILFSKRKYILIVCATATLAENFLADVTDALDCPNVSKLFGDWRSDIINDKESLKRFVFQERSITLVPRGKGGAIRGTNVSWERPDLIINDDIQTKEEARSEEISRQIMQWFLGTLMKARSPRCCTVIYLGNMYPDVPMGEKELDPEKQLYCCLLRNLQRLAEWRTWITGAILADGTALWEEVHPLQELLADLRQDTALGEADTFFAEVQNDPAAVNSRWLDTSKIKEVPYNEYDLVVGKFLVIDPSLGKKKSDEQPVGLFYVYDNKGPVLKEVRVIQKSAPDLVREVLTWALEERVPLIVAESVAYQATLIQWFVFFINQLGIEGIQCAGVTPKGLSKASRILAYFKSLMAGSAFLDDKAKPMVLAQAQLYDPTATKPMDDILDVGAYGQEVFVQYSAQYMLPLEEVYSTHTDNNKLPDTSDVSGALEYNPASYY